MMGKMEREKRNKERKEERKEGRGVADQRSGDGVTDSDVTISDGCGREGRNAFLFIYF